MAAGMDERGSLEILMLAGLLAALGGCGGTIDPCAGVSCSDHGRCQLAGHLANCQCDPGYYADGLECLLEEPCAHIDCGGHGGCVLHDGRPACVCEEGFHAAGLYCVGDQDPCDGVDCNGHGTCTLQDGSPLCRCDQGFYPAGLTCLEENDPCAGIDCSGHGMCLSSEGQAYCECQAGYLADGLNCLPVGVCEEVQCGSHGFCVDAGGQPACQCDPGYHAEGLSCLPDDPCGTVDCGPHGDCLASGGQASCQCDAGYHPEGLTCVEDDPCQGISCGLNAHCELGECLCDDGYHGDPDVACEIYKSEEERIRQKLVQIAEAELGYCNGDDRPYMLDQPYGWCYDFVDWVYMEADEGLPHLWELPEVYTLNAPDGWLPKPGDLIKYYFQHYCMVAEVLDGGATIHTIEGNYNSCVVRNTTEFSDVAWVGTLEEFFQ